MDSAAKAGFQLVAAGDGRLAASGPLTFATARQASTVGRAALRAAAGVVEINCAGVTASDSAGLAVLIDWLAAAREAGHSLRYTQLPAGLVALGRISEVTELLTGAAAR
jgi:phospholipid transport system transporter-binding protein